MNYTNTELFLFFGLVSLGTFLTRVLLFILFPENKKIPRYIKYLSNFLPYTIIGMLVVYCLKDVSFTVSPYALPEIISIAAIFFIAPMEEEHSAQHWLGLGSLYGFNSICFYLILKLFYKIASIVAFSFDKSTRLSHNG